MCLKTMICLSCLLVSQIKELKSRIADMGTQTRPSAGVTMLEHKVQELEDRLRSEERYTYCISVSARLVLSKNVKNVMMPAFPRSILSTVELVVSV